MEIGFCFESSQPGEPIYKSPWQMPHINVVAMRTVYLTN